MNQKKTVRRRMTFSYVRLAGSFAGILVGYLVADAIDPLAPSGGWGLVGVVIFAAFAIAGAVLGSLLDRRMRGG